MEIKPSSVCDVHLTSQTHLEWVKVEDKQAMATFKGEHFICNKNKKEGLLHLRYKKATIQPFIKTVPWLHQL